MITKVFFTMLVIVIVGMVFRSKNQSQQAQRNSTSEQVKAHVVESSIAPKTVAYLLVGLLIIVSGVVYYFSWADANQLVTLRVIDASGGLSEYQAYQKDIRGRAFTSIGGVSIQLADTDRLEMLIQ